MARCHVDVMEGGRGAVVEGGRVTAGGAGGAQAVERSAMVCSPAERPATVRALFHNSTVDRASTGCLLEQVPPPAYWGVGEPYDGGPPHCRTG